MGENERLILKKLGINEILSFRRNEIGKNITNSLLNPNMVLALNYPIIF